MKNNTELNLCHFYSLQKEYRKHGWAVPYSEFCQMLTHTHHPHPISPPILRTCQAPALAWGSWEICCCCCCFFLKPRQHQRWGQLDRKKGNPFNSPSTRWCILWAKSSGFTRLRWLCQVNKNTLTSQLHNTVMVHNMNKNSHQSPKLTVGRTAQGSVITLCHHKPEVSPRASPGHRGNAAAEEMSCWFLRNESVTCIGGFAA